MPTVLTEKEKTQFLENGYTIVKKFFDEEEIELLQRASNEDPAIRKHWNITTRSNG